MMLQTMAVWLWSFSVVVSTFGLARASSSAGIFRFELMDPSRQQKHDIKKNEATLDHPKLTRQKYLRKGNLEQETADEEKGFTLWKEASVFSQQQQESSTMRIFLSPKKDASTLNKNEDKAVPVILENRSQFQSGERPQEVFQSQGMERGQCSNFSNCDKDDPWKQAICVQNNENEHMKTLCLGSIHEINYWIREKGAYCGCCSEDTDEPGRPLFCNNSFVQAQTAAASLSNITSEEAAISDESYQDFTFSENFARRKRRNLNGKPSIKDSSLDELSLSFAIEGKKDIKGKKGIICSEFSGCDGDPDKIAICRHYGKGEKQGGNSKKVKTVCVRSPKTNKSSKRIDKLIAEGSECGCCSPQDETDRPAYCDTAFDLTVSPIELPSPGPPRKPSQMPNKYPVDIPTTYPTVTPNTPHQNAPDRPTHLPIDDPTSSPSTATPKLDPATDDPTSSPSTAAPKLDPQISRVAVEALFVRGDNRTLTGNAEAIAEVMGGTVDPLSILYPLFASRPVSYLRFDVMIDDYDDDKVVDVASFQSNAIPDYIRSNSALRDYLVISISSGEEVVNVASCADQCTSANDENDLPSGYCYPPTDTCICTGRYGGTTCGDLCYSLQNSSKCDATEGCSWCETTEKCLVSNNLARTTDERESCPVCTDFENQERFCQSAPLCSFCPSTETCSFMDNPSTCPFDVSSTSPQNGEENVAVTRKTEMIFTEPVNSSTVTTDVVQVLAHSEILNTTLRLSSNGLKLFIFYELSGLPANTEITVRVNDRLVSMAGNSLSSTYEFSFSTLSVLSVAGTMICGRVYASEQSKDTEGEWIDIALEGVTITVDGNPSIKATTSSDGSFVMDNVPAGTFFVHINGKTSTQSTGGSYYPNVGKSWTAVAGSMTSVGTVYLPLIASGTLQVLKNNETTVVQFPEEVIGNDTRLRDVSLRVPPGSLIDSVSTDDPPMVGIAPVDRDRLPGTLPPTLRLPLVITIQTMGGSNFDMPVPVCFPNLPDPVTNMVLEPGDATSLWSFNHDTGRFDVVGPATVNSEGTLVCSDPGYGIVAPGWHGAAPGTPVDPPEDEPECEDDPCCGSDDPCCDSDSGSGGDEADNDTSWWKAGFSVGDAIFGCIKDYIAKKYEKTWGDSFACWSNVFGLAKDVVTPFVSDKPDSAAEVFAGVGKVQGGKFGIIKECLGAALNLFPWYNAVEGLVEAYKCASSLAGALNDNCKAAGWGDNPECSTLDDICKKVDDLMDFLKPINNGLDILGFFGLRRLDGLISSQELDELTAIKNISVDYIIDTLDTLNTISNGTLSDEEALAIFDVFYENMQKVIEVTDVLRGLEIPMMNLIDTFDEMVNQITLYASSVEKKASEISNIQIEKRELYIYIETEDNTEFRIKTTEAGEIVGFIMAPTVYFFCMAYDARNDQFGFANGLSSPNGVRTVLPSMTFGPASDLGDIDGDGLCDECEFIIGTDPNSRDTDGDGVGDRQEILSGTNPFDGIALTTGVVGNFPLPQSRGSPVAVEAAGSRVYVALSRGGIACYNTFDALEPSLTNVIGTGYVFSKISVREDAVLGLTSLRTVVLLSGPEFSDILEVNDLLGDATAIYLGEEYAVLGTERGLVSVYTPDFEFKAQDIAVGGSFSNGITAVSLTPFGSLVAVSGGRLSFFQPDDTGRRPWKETASSVSSSGPSVSLSSDTERVYAGTSGRIAVSSAISGLSLGVGNVGAITNGFVVMDPNGENIAVLTTNQVQLWSFENPSAPSFQGAFGFEGSVNQGCIAGSNGLIYVGTSTALSIVNVFPPDTAGLSPIVTNVQAIDQNEFLSNSSFVQEFRVLRVFADVRDDFSVRQVRFVANGPGGEFQRTVDSIYPYTTSISVPAVLVNTTEDSSILDITVTAWDVAGNVAETYKLSFEIIEDTQAPIPIVTSPDSNTTVLVSASATDEIQEDLSIVVVFSEPVDLVGNPFDFVELVYGNESQAVNVSQFEFKFSPTLNLLELIIPKSELSLGSYEAAIVKGVAIDSKGNPSEAVASFSFILAPNELFIDKPSRCSVSLGASCNFTYKPNTGELQLWQPLALALISKRAPRYSNMRFEVFKGPDSSYPPLNRGRWCYDNSDEYDIISSDPFAFEVEPFVFTYTVVVSSDSPISFDIELVLSGLKQEIEVGKQALGTIELTGQIHRYLLPKGSQDREIIVSKEGGVYLQIHSTNSGNTVTMNQNTNTQRFILSHSSDYWVDVHKTSPSLCNYIYSSDQSTNYSFSIYEPFGVQVLENLEDPGDSVTCHITGLGDYCDISFYVDLNLVGFPVPFHVAPKNVQLSSYSYQVEIRKYGTTELQLACSDGFNLQTRDEFVPKFSGWYTMRIRERPYWYSRENATLVGAEFNVTYGSNPQQSIVDLPINTVHNGTFTFVGDIGWYRVSDDISRGHVVAVTVSNSLGHEYYVKVMTASGRVIRTAYFYGESATPAIKNLVVEFDGPMLIAVIPSLYRCMRGSSSWNNTAGHTYRIAVWKEPPKAPFYDLLSAPLVSYGESVFCSLGNVADFCQFRLVVSSEQVGLPLSFYVVEPSEFLTTKTLQIYENGKSVLSHSCSSSNEMSIVADLFPQSKGDLEIRLLANQIGNMTLRVGPDSAVSSTALNNQSDPESNFTSTIAGSFDDVIVRTFYASNGDVVSANASFGSAYGYLSLVHLPMGRYLQSNRFGAFDGVKIQVDGLYAVIVSPLRNRFLCQSRVNLAANGTIVVVKVSGEPEEVTVPNPEPIVGSLSRIINAECDMTATELNACAYLLSVSEEDVNVPMSVLLTHPESSQGYQTTIKIFHRESYYDAWTSTIFSDNSCYRGDNRYLLELGGFSFPRAGSYVLLHETSTNISETLFLSIGTNRNESIGSFLTDGSTFEVEFQNDKIWNTFQIEVNEDHAFIALSLIEGSKNGIHFYLIDPTGFRATIQPGSAPRDVRHPGVYTLIAAPVNDQWCIYASSLEGSLNTTFTVLVSLLAVKERPEMLPDLALGESVDCLIERPYGECAFKFDIGAEQVGIPFSIFPEIIELGDTTNNLVGTSWYTRLELFDSNNYPSYSLSVFGTCSTGALGSCQEPSCQRTRTVDNVLFTRQGSYVLRVSNNYWERTAHLLLTMSPRTVHVIPSVTNLLGNGSSTVVTGSLGRREISAFLFENIQKDVAFVQTKEPDMELLNMNLRFDKTVVDNSYITVLQQGEFDTNTNETGAILTLSHPQTWYCRQQDSLPWLTEAERNFTIEVFEYEEYPILPAPVIELGDTVTCTISTPAMYCAYEFLLSDQDIHKVLPIYFDSPILETNLTVYPNHRWRTSVHIFSVAEYPNRALWSHSFYYYRNRAEQSLRYTPSRPGKYVLRVGNSEVSPVRALGSINIHFGYGNRAAWNGRKSLNQEIVGYGQWADSYQIEGMQNDFISINLFDDGAARRIVLMDCLGQQTSANSYLNTPVRSLYQLRNSGPHQVVVESALPSDPFWNVTSNDNYTVSIWKTNPELGPSERIRLFPNGPLDFECALDRPWSYCTFEIDVTPDMLISSSSINFVTSNVRGMDGNVSNFGFRNSWIFETLFDRNEYATRVATRYSYGSCNEKSFRTPALVPGSVGLHTIRIGNSQKLGQGTFDVSFADIWRQLEGDLVIDEVVSNNFTNWSNVHSFRINATDSTFKVTVKSQRSLQNETNNNSSNALEDAPVEFVAKRIDNPGWTGYRTGPSLGTAERIFYRGTNSDLILEIWPRWTTTAGCDDGLDVTTWPFSSYTYTVTLSLV